MKIIYLLLLINLSFTQVGIAESVDTSTSEKFVQAGIAKPVDIGTFEKLDENERQKAINQAPPEQRAQLKHISWHLHLLGYWKGEEGLKAAKESCVIRARGLGWLEDPVGSLEQVWQSFDGDKTAEGATAGLKDRELAAAEQRLADTMTVRMRALAARSKIVHNLVFHIAPTPQALALNEQAEKLCRAMSERVELRCMSTRQFIKDAERAQFDKQVDEFVDALKKLPTLPESAVQHEYETFPEEGMPSDGFG